MTSRSLPTLVGILGRAALRGMLVGLAVVASCSGAGPNAERALDPVQLAEVLEKSPCGGGNLRLVSADSRAAMTQGFDAWPLPQVFVSADELGDDAVACFDGRAVLVETEHADDRVILAHEFCHAIAYLYDRTAPMGFPSPTPQSPRALALEPEVWHQEIWAVSCSTGVSGDEDWSWGHLVYDSTAEAIEWAASFVAAGPEEPLVTPVNWVEPQRPVLATP